MVYEEKENNIEWIKGSERATASFTQQKFISQFKELAVKYPEQVEIAAENKDGSVLVHFPSSWVKVRPKMELSEEQRKKLAERAKVNLRK